MLLPLRQSRLARGADHEQDHRLFGFARKLVLSQIDREVESDVRVVASRSFNLMNAQLLERHPVLDCDVGVDERGLHQIGQPFLLFLRQFWTDEGDHAVVTGEHAILRSNTRQLLAPRISDFHFLGGGVGANVRDMDDRAVQPNTNR